MTKTLLRIATMPLLLLSLAATANAEIRLIAQGSIPGSAIDKSGLTGALSDGTPLNNLGSCGSAIAYTGIGNRYVLAADRGPKDGATEYPCRVHVFDIAVNANGGLTWDVQETKLLKDAAGRDLVGLASAINPGATGQRFDPEGVRVGSTGAFFVADEYGPDIIEFDSKGKPVRTIRVPDRFRVAKPAGDPIIELAQNKSGRVPNRGMEGLAISPDGTRLIGAMQSPLIQDGGGTGTFLRLLDIDLRSGASHEFAYPLENEKMAVSEILAINDHEYLVLERTGSSDPALPRSAKIYKIDQRGASDISAVDALPKSSLPASVTHVKKELFLDLLDPAFGLAGKDFPAKIEGLAFGPDLPDGRRLLLVTSDNDCGEAPTRLFAFAIDQGDLPDYQRQAFSSSGPRRANAK